MRVAVTGASGLVGSALVPHWRAQGHEVLRFVRHAAHGPDEVPWDPARGVLDPGLLHGVDAVVHLAGENVADGRWNPARRQAILDSRVHGGRLLATVLAGLAQPPAVLISASAVGWYGDTGDRQVDEQTPAGTGFLADVCRAWEASVQPARDAGTRVVTLRLGIVLSAHGGALAKMLPAFRMGAGGPIGSGWQWMSWITLADLVAVFDRALADATLQGPVNAVAPGAVPQREFAAALGRALHRPALVPLPAPVVRLLFGQMGQELLLQGQRVQPKVLQSRGFVWQAADLDQAFAQILPAA